MADDLTNARDYPQLEDLTKATGRMNRINSETGLSEPDPETGEKMVPKLTLSPVKGSQYDHRLYAAQDLRNRHKRYTKTMVL